MNTGRTRILNAISHKESDRIPKDFGATRPTGIVKNAYQELNRYLDINDENIDVCTYGQDLVANTANVSIEVQEKLDVDARGLFMGKPDNANEKMISPTEWRDELGVIWKNSKGMWTPEDSPIRNEFSIETIKKLSLPTGTDLGYVRGLKEKAQKIRKEDKYALVMHLQDIVVHPTQNLLGMEDWFVNLLMEKNEMHYLLDRIVELRIEQAISILREIGDLVDVVSQSDDLGTQSGPIISTELYNEMILPYHKKYFEAIQKYTNAKIFLHSCGSIYKFIPNFIELGVDCLNPVQISAKDMQPEKLKKEFGKDIVFWGGIDTQELVKIEDKNKRLDYIKRITDVLATDGGYVLASIHNIQDNVPPELIKELFLEKSY